MKTTLNTLKNLYAQEQGYRDWEALQIQSYDTRLFESHMNEICIRAQKASLEKYFEWHKSQGFVSHKPSDIQEFIANPENLIL